MVRERPLALDRRVHARHELLLDGGASSGNYMIGSSNEFVVRPFGFDIDFNNDGLLDLYLNNEHIKFYFTVCPVK